MTGRFGMDEPSVVMTRTPLRVSFMGGGSDTKEFYAKEGPGQVISLALDKYIYVIIKTCVSMNRLIVKIEDCLISEGKYKPQLLKKRIK